MVLVGAAVIHQSSVSAEASNGVSSEAPYDKSHVAEPSSRKFKIPYSALKYASASVDAAMIVIASLLGGGIYQVTANGELLYLDPLLGVGPVAALLYVLIGHS